MWAASYGLDEGGEEVPELRAEDVQQRKERINEMLFELLYLVDIHGLLRKPSWDGVRALLLILPLTEGACHLTAPAVTAKLHLHFLRGANSHGTPGERRPA